MSTTGDLRMNNKFKKSALAVVVMQLLHSAHVAANEQLQSMDDSHDGKISFEEFKVTSLTTMHYLLSLPYSGTR